MTADDAALDDAALDALFEAWARWMRSDAGSLASLGYPSCTAERRAALRGGVMSVAGRPHGPLPPGLTLDEAAEAMDRAMSALRVRRPKQYAALALRHLRYGTDSQHARALRVPVSTFASWAARGRANVRILLAKP